ncbi:hypothetical protein D3C71_1857360 [compost metagenome]
MAALENGVEPQRDFGQLNGYRIQVNTEYIAVRDVHFDPLLFVGVALVRDSLSQLLLLGRKVSFGQLAYGFVQERCAAHGRFTNGKSENFVRRFTGQDFL